MVYDEYVKVDTKKEYRLDKYRAELERDDDRSYYWHNAEAQLYIHNNKHYLLVYDGSELQSPLKWSVWYIKKDYKLNTFTRYTFKLYSDGSFYLQSLILKARNIDLYYVDNEKDILENYILDNFAL